MKISNKKRNQLYEVVHNEVMNCRVGLMTLLKGKLSERDYETLDRQLYLLTLNAPQKAIDLFNPPTNENNKH